MSQKDKLWQTEEKNVTLQKSSLKKYKKPEQINASAKQFQL